MVTIDGKQIKLQIWDTVSLFTTTDCPTIVELLKKQISYCILNI